MQHKSFHSVRHIFPLRRLLALGAVGFLSVACFHQPTQTNSDVIQAEPLNQNFSSVPLNTEPERPSPATFPFTAATPASSFQDSLPQAQDILPQAPLKVVIDSSTPLTVQSTISITNGGIEYGVGAVGLNEPKTSLFRNMTQSAPDGLYTVTYTLCGEATACSTGSFQFAIDSFWLSQYQNWSNLSLVDINIEGSAFLPRYLRISAGTTVTWTNTDTVSHSIDSDPFGTHSYNPSLSSFELKPGESYSFTFGTPGWYPYRCSFHPQTMTGAVLVE